MDRLRPGSQMRNENGDHGKATDQSRVSVTQRAEKGSRGIPAARGVEGDPATTDVYTSI